MGKPNKTKELKYTTSSTDTLVDTYDSNSPLLVNLTLCHLMCTSHLPFRQQFLGTYFATTPPLPPGLIAISSCSMCRVLSLLHGVRNISPLPPGVIPSRTSPLLV